MERPTGRYDIRASFPGTFGFADLIAPRSVESFANNVFGKEAEFLGNGARVLTGVLPEHELIRLIQSSSEQKRELRVVKQGTITPPRPIFDERGADIASVMDAYERGYTVVLNQLHRRSPALAALCQGMEIETSQRVGCNLYLTPSNSQGEPVHYDVHDIFVVQLQGSKHWRTFAPVLELPLASQAMSGELRVDGEPLIEKTLNPGDVMYLPRGTPHEANTTTQPSVHLSLGIVGTPYVDLIIEALRAYAGRNVDARKVPRLQNLCDGRPTSVSESMRRIVEDFQTSPELQKVPLEGWLNAIRSLPFLSDGESVVPKPSISEDTVVRKRSGVIAVVDPCSVDVPTLVFPGGSARFPPPNQCVPQFLAETESFRVADLPDSLSPTEKIALAKRFVALGVLVQAS